MFPDWRLETLPIYGFTTAEFAKEIGVSPDVVRGWCYAIMHRDVSLRRELKMKHGVVDVKIHNGRYAIEGRVKEK